MNRTPFLLALALLGACASGTDVIDERTLRCGPGQDIEVRAGILDPATTREAAGSLMYLVEVANNSLHDVTVKSIRIEPHGTTEDELHGVRREFDQVIEGGEDHLFEIPANDAWVRSRDFRLGPRRMEFVARVSLSNGDSYACPFETRWK